MSVMSETVDWEKLLTIRDQCAKEAWRKHGRRFPVEEYYSEGNQILTETLHGYVESMGPLDEVCRIRLRLRLRKVPYFQSEAGTTYEWEGSKPRYREVETVSHAPDAALWETVLHPALPHGETRTFVHELCSDMGKALGLAALGSYVCHVLGWTSREIGAMLGCSHTTVQRNRRKVVEPWIAERKASWTL